MYLYRKPFNKMNAYHIWPVWSVDPIRMTWQYIWAMKLESYNGTEWLLRNSVSHGIAIFQIFVTRNSTHHHSFFCVLFFKRCGMSVCMCFLVYLCQYIKMTQNLMIIIDNYNLWFIKLKLSTPIKFISVWKYNFFHKWRANHVQLNY